MVAHRGSANDWMTMNVRESSLKPQAQTKVISVPGLQGSSVESVRSRQSTPYAQPVVESSLLHYEESLRGALSKCAASGSIGQLVYST